MRRLFVFFLVSFLAFLFSPFLIFAAVIDLPLGLLSVQNLSRKHNRDGHILLWSSHVAAENFALSFSHKFLRIFLHISGAIEPITLI